LEPNEQSVSYLDTPHNPTALRFRWSVGWEKGAVFVSSNANFQSGYTDPVSTPSRHVASWTTLDLVLGYRIGVLDRKVGGDTSITLNGFNVFNKQPPFLNNNVGSVGYDPENADLLGRRLSLRIAHEW